MNIYLHKMTKALARQFFQGFTNDPDICSDMHRFAPYVYTEEGADAYWERQHRLGRMHLALMLGNEPIGEILLKHMDRESRSCTLSIHMKNDSVKNRGYGTCGEILALMFAFGELEMETVYADALTKNQRSRHVLEKVGFAETHCDGTFHYYRCDKAAWAFSGAETAKASAVLEPRS